MNDHQKSVFFPEKILQNGTRNSSDLETGVTLMAFGFPAYHNEEINDIPNEENPRRLVKRALKQLGWSISRDEEDYIRASTTLSFWSWGERIEIELDDQSVQITSKCALATQCVDWGKNKSNVKKLVKAIYEQLEEVS